MKVLHLTPLSKPSVGILNQIKDENAAAKELGIEWESKALLTESTHANDYLDVCVSQSTKVGLGTKHSNSDFNALQSRWNTYKYLNDISSDYDVILLRYTYADPFQALSLRRIRTPIFTVHHTIETVELQLGKGIRGKSRMLAESALGPVNIRSAFGVIGVTKEIVEYELGRSRTKKPSLVMPNGVLFENTKRVIDERGDTPIVVFIASEFAPWHGLGILLRSLVKSTRGLELHLVGKVQKEDLQLVESDDRVVLHGSLTQEDLAPILARAWVGLSSFGLEKTGMKEACSLKVREYLAAGVPVYAGHRDCFPPEFEYFLECEPNIDQIVDFAVQMRNVDKRQIAVASRKYISKTEILSEAYDIIQKLIV